MTMGQTNDSRFMRLALDACRKGVDLGQSPFGACIVRGDQVLACTHNHVWKLIDATAHAEVMAIRQACQAVQSVLLPECTIYSTTEPCPMCFAAIHWARIRRIVYGASIADAQAYGFNELAIPNTQLASLGRMEVELVPDFLRQEAIELYRYWQQRGGKTY